MDKARDEQVAFSWARSAEAETVPAGGVRAALRRRLQDVSWFDIAVAIAATGVFDLVIGLIISGYYSSKCRDVCTLHQQAHEDRMLFILVPILLGLPPVLLALWIRRLRVLLAALQAAVCLGFMVHAALDLRTVNSRINGTAPCWNTLYSPKDCPWGVR